MPIRPERYPANRLFALLAASFALLFTFVIVVLAVDQERVREASERLQQQTVPKIIRFQRLARNLDQLRQEGEQIFSSGTPEGRQQSLYLVMLVASHPSILEHSQAAGGAPGTPAVPALQKAEIPPDPSRLWWLAFPPLPT